MTRFLRLTAFCALILLLVTLATPLIGPSAVSYSRAFHGLSPDREILFDLRLPRVLLASLAGGTLAVAGAVFQAMFRDALATPYTIGVSSGASLGAVVAICLGLQTIAGLPAVSVAAGFGGLASLLIVTSIASRQRSLSPFTLLLSGVTINSVAFAAILFLQSVAGFSQSFAIVRWLMGGLDSVSYRTLAWLAAVCLIGCCLLIRLARQWNLLAAGEEWAAARGIEPQRLLRTGYLTVSLLVGLVTSLAGPIGFVDLIVPHALRLKIGADHRLLLPCSFLLGAAFLNLCDTLARTITLSGELPVGVLTAMLGGPAFLWILRTRRVVTER